MVSNDLSELFLATGWGFAKCFLANPQQQSHFFRQKNIVEAPVLSAYLPL